MQQRFATVFALLLMVSVGAGALRAQSYEPAGLILTWQQDPTTTMTIDWHTLPDQQRPTVVQYRLADTQEAWSSEEGDTRPFPYTDRTIHRVELIGLKPGSTYEFRLGEDARVLRFRTMPATLDEPLRFAIGGDTNPGGYMRRSNFHALRYDPQFIVWGGDLAYANGRERLAHRWLQWMESTRRTLVTDDGRVVPLVVCIGNHEVRSVGRAEDATDAEYRADRAPYFSQLFAFPQEPGYDALDFGDYLTLIALDTSHVHPIEGPQTEWLAEVLRQRADEDRHIIPFYHVAAFPSVRAYGSEGASTIREHWVPLFEQAGVELAFEHNDHAYKRTPPIRDGKIAPNDGITYLGDGAWGVSTRKPRTPESTWYIERSEQKHHAIIVTLGEDWWHTLTLGTDPGDNGRIIDEFPADVEHAGVLRLEPEVWRARPDLPHNDAARSGDAAGDDSDDVLQAVPLPTEGWQIKLDPRREGYTSGWHEPAFDDADWDTFEIGRHWTREPAYLNYAGPAWYRRTVDVPARPQDAGEVTAQLAFAGVDEMAWVWVNGEFIGQHAIGPEGWNIPFAFDITDAIAWGQPNHITIMAENTQDGGGVYEAVTLRVLRDATRE